ncbi:hypothetical protein [Aureispira sp. CCB-E]|uniref:hypothetical protein n=1 Tax=Aureispira sp. CCB-E TaxID=3051121 RepID=UPI00286855C0|nr:hypothetical protein [Aureispira sp. CCB-E]WMX14917.1 hypothetical protein QP953_00870 [Aureispira sp. CCB-E]
MLLNIQRDRFLDDFYELKTKNEEIENKISELEQKIDAYTNKLDIQVYQRIINTRFNVSKISSLSVKYMSSGQFLMNTIDEMSDFSPVIIQYGRTIENELKEIFLSIDASKKWMLGLMQGSLEKFKYGSTELQHCNTSHFSQLVVELENQFNSPMNLKIDLIDYLRNVRNSAGHSGTTKTKQEAINYIEKVNDFLDKWILEKK